MDDQDKELQSARIKQLLCLIDEMKEIDENIDTQPGEFLMKQVSDTVQLQNRIISELSKNHSHMDTRKNVLDSILLKFNHQIISKILQQNSIFDDTMYANAILEMITEDSEEKWEKFINFAYCFGRFAYSNPSLLGYINVKTKPLNQKTRAQSKKSKLTAEQRPETTNMIERQQKFDEKVKDIIYQIYKIFRRNDMKPIPYYKLVIDPTSLNNTVQSAFQLSFLISENRIAIEDGVDGFPQVRFFDNPEAVGESSQAVANFTMELCKNMSNFYHIKEPMLKWN